MSDSDFVDIGDELTVRVSGFPVGKAKVLRFENDEVVATLLDFPGGVEFRLPLDVKSYDTIDGYGHASAPLTGLPDQVEDPPVIL